MPLHCAATRSKFLNVQHAYFLNPFLVRFLRIKITIHSFFLLSLPAGTLVLTSFCKINILGDQNERV